MAFIDSKQVTTAGTPEVLTTRDVVCSAVVIKARDANTGLVYIVDQFTTSKKFPSEGLAPGDNVTIPTQNPATLLVDVSVNGEWVDWIAV